MTMTVRTRKRGVVVPVAAIKPASDSDVLPPLTATEAKNGWNAKELDAYLRGLHLGNPFAYYYEIVARWRETERIAGEALAKFKREHDLGDPAEKRRLAELERAVSHATAQVNLAVDRLENG